MSGFESWHSYSDFALFVQKSSRYILNEKTRQFIETVVETSKKRITKIEKGEIFFRAQRGCDFRPLMNNDINIDDIPFPYKGKRMFPISGTAFEGRANPKGITYIYIASDKDTACAEVRPWVGGYISVAELKSLRELLVVDCSKAEYLISIYLEEPDQETKENIVWRNINNAFSKPVNLEDTGTEYIPTQVIAEAIKHSGLDGIAFKSSYAEGLNYVIYDMDAFELSSCYLTQVKGIKYDFNHQDIGYNVKKYTEI